MLSLPGVALSAAITSASELNFELAGAIRIRPKVAMLATGIRSFAAYGRLGYSDGKVITTDESASSNV